MRYVEWAVGLFRNYAAHLVLFAALGGLVVVIRLGYLAFIGPVIGAVLGGVFGILLKPNVETPQATPQLNWRLGWIATSLYVLLTIAVYRPISRTRPLMHYLLFGLMAGFLAYQIYDGQSRKHILPQLLVFAFITYWTTQFAFPAGANSPDTFQFISLITQVIEQAVVPSNIVYASTPGHMIYIAEATLLTGETVQLMYYLLSTAALIVTIVFIGSFGDVIPEVSRRTALFAALLFSIMSFTLQRGMYPTKLNFYKPLIVIGIVAVYHALYSKSISRRYMIIVTVSAAALVYGHTYSLGATMIVIGVLGGFKFFTNLLQGLDYDSTLPSGSIMAVALVFPIVLFGYALVGGNGILGRVAGILLSTLELFFQTSTETATGSGGGRYSELSVKVLLFSTAGQTILFTFSVIGVTVALKQCNWDYDSIVVWIASGLSLIVFSLFVNAVDIPTPRIYGLLAIFGLNITMTLGIYALSQSVPIKHRSVVGVVVALFAVFSLASPVAGYALSPVNDEIPHYKMYETNPGIESTRWEETYLEDGYPTAKRSNTELPIRANRQSKHAVIDRARIEEGRVYVYTEVAAKTGVISNRSGPRLGGREYVFLDLPETSKLDNEIYSNGQVSVFQKKVS